MHPAYSVILFTTASGAGYGLLCLMGLGVLTGTLPPDRLLGLLGLSLALALITAGLLSSTFHLGHPERAWRALSQWRSSWLSREGVLAVATYVPTVVMWFGWSILGRTDGVFAVAALLACVLAPLTVLATGMIYQSLLTVRQWHQPLTTPIYVALALATGCVLLSMLSALAGTSAGGTSRAAAILTVIACGLKVTYWRAIDLVQPLANPGTATGLGRFGRVRQLEAPHSQANFVMREMGFAVARKHTRRLRAIVLIALFATPFLLCLVATDLSGGLETAALVLATMGAALGVIIERWLFFAEAEHVVVNFYAARTV